MSRTIVFISLVLMFVTGLMVMNHHHSQPPVPQVDSSIPILHYPDCYDVRTPEGWETHISIAGGEYLDWPVHVNTILEALCPEIYGENSGSSTPQHRQA